MAMSDRIDKAADRWRSGEGPGPKVPLHLLLRVMREVCCGVSLLLKLTNTITQKKNIIHRVNYIKFNSYNIWRIIISISKEEYIIQEYIEEYYEKVY